LFEYERRRRYLAEIMREVSVALTSTLQLDDVLELILDGLALVVDYDAASILLNNEAGEMILRAMRGATGADDAVGQPLTVRRFEAGEEIPAVLPFAEADLAEEYHSLLALPDPHACLAAPLAPGGEHVGYLVVDRANQSRFPQSEVELVATFASQAAVAIENARLYTAQREQAWVSTALLQVADATARAAELDDVLETVARLTPMLVGVDRCAILMADGGQWRLAAFSGLGDGAPGLTVDELNQQFPEGLPTAGWTRFDEMLELREPVVLDPDEPMPPGLRELFVGVVILLPLLAKGEVEGVLIVGQVPGETPFTAHRIRLMGGIANQAALAIESSLLTAAQQEEAWVSTALLQVAESVAGQPLEQGLETASRLTPILVGVDKLAIYQYVATAGTFRLCQVAGLEPPAEAQPAALSLNLADLGLHSDDPLFETAPPWRLSLPAHLADWFGSADCFVWPLRAREDVLGALVVQAMPLLGRRLTILNGIAYQLAMAMENARLALEVAHQERLERELEVGRDIQASFLPQSYPQAEGWEVSAFWRAARQVGGDFYDFIPLQPGQNGPRWGIVIADVADKGVPAALFMALSRTLLRTVAINRIRPADTLARVNELILADARSEQFVTIFYGVWEPHTGSLRYALGGHNPPIWARPDGAVGPLPGRGIALGVLEGAQYQEYQVRLDPGAALVLFTDGLTDAVNDSYEEFGLARALDLVRATRHAPAEAILAAIASAVESHVGARESFDDLTFVIFKRRELPSTPDAHATSDTSIRP
jgi:serine phosphatase RsbU (regulator of sigma subunit)